MFNKQPTYLTRINLALYSSPKWSILVKSNFKLFVLVLLSKWWRKRKVLENVFWLFLEKRLNWREHIFFFSNLMLKARSIYLFHLFQWFSKQERAKKKKSDLLKCWFYVSENKSKMENFTLPLHEILSNNIVTSY